MIRIGGLGFRKLDRDSPGSIPKIPNKQLKPPANTAIQENTW